jgi:hypothetical protein
MAVNALLYYVAIYIFKIRDTTTVELMKNDGHA